MSSAAPARPAPDAAAGARADAGAPPRLPSTLGPVDPRGLRIGLMGGSFNPAHEGHRMVALLALKRLRLHRVWWLVSPRNPLKDAADLAPLTERLAGARAVADHPRIEVAALEERLGTTYTADTLRLLLRRYPRAQFVWTMGADNFLELPRWRDWRYILATVPVAVFDRPAYALPALSGRAARAFARFRLPERRSRALAERRAPAWAFHRTALNPASATAIREAARNDAGETAIPTETSAPPPPGLLDLALGSLDDDKAEDVAIVDLAGRSTIGDHMVIASGRSTRHVTAMAEHLLARLKRSAAPRANVEGLRQGDWVLIDAGDVIVHLFRPEVREFYGLEKMWGVAAPPASGDGGEAGADAGNGAPAADDPAAAGARG